MVRLSATLLRVPLIKFRKGGMGHAAPRAPAGAPAAAAAPAAASAAAPPPSSSAKDPSSSSKLKVEPTKKDQKNLATINIPKGILIERNKKKKLVSLSITFEKPGKINKSS